MSLRNEEVQWCKKSGAYNGNQHDEADGHSSHRSVAGAQTAGLGSTRPTDQENNRASRNQAAQRRLAGKRRKEAQIGETSQDSFVDREQHDCPNHQRQWSEADVSHAFAKEREGHPDSSATGR
ncbi:hypothetical protein IVB30_21275 [Bradyrhizobium sp. 200]|uniref:hypothetical protein n=1 Tax=Bradyrhizobium sp. 200 TaxID=2782665 RepID=UPI0020004B12|nr:hypothetical protein [Bradyrhizobium sp. 200]UPJ53612.1 hypothetical protein IVB30_21275 [Bradyrhizobium sp. 200]